MDPVMDPEATTVYLEYLFVTSHNPEIEETHSHVPYTSVFLPVFYTAVFLIGVSGNLILMSALHFKRGSRRPEGRLMYKEHGSGSLQFQDCDL